MCPLIEPKQTVPVTSSIENDPLATKQNPSMEIAAWFMYLLHHDARLDSVANLNYLHFTFAEKNSWLILYHIQLYIKYLEF